MPSCITYRRLFFILRFRRAILLHFFAFFCGTLYQALFFCTFSVRTMYERVVQHLLCIAAQTQRSAISPPKSRKASTCRSECDNASKETESIYCIEYRKHSTAHRNQAAQSRKASTCRSRCDNASKQTELARASTCRRAFKQHAEFSKRTKTSKSARPRKIYNCSHSAGVMREGFAFNFDLYKTQHRSFCPSFICISYMHAASGLLSWSMELFAFCKSSVCV